MLFTRKAPITRKELLVKNITSHKPSFAEKRYGHLLKKNFFNMKRWNIEKVKNLDSVTLSYIETDLDKLKENAIL